VTYGAILAAKLLLVAVVVVLGVNPRWRLSRFLWKSRGPRGDVVCLTRRQLLAEGAKYLYVAVLCFLAMWLLQAGSEAFAVAESSAVMGAFFITSILMGMAVLAGVYMLVRGVFRSSRYVPPAHCGQRTEVPSRLVPPADR
jgi:hypothetical protein